MNPLHPNNGACQSVRNHLDSYVSNELPVETSQEILRHLEACPACSGELAAIATLKARVRSAATQLAAPPLLAARIQTRLHRYEKTRRSGFERRYWLVAVAAALILCLGTWQMLRVLGIRREQLLRVGFSDHLHCAVPRIYDKPAETSQHMREALGPEFAQLLPVIRTKVPETYVLEMAHHCEVNGRKYVHFIFRNDSALISVVLTKKENAETFRNTLVPVIAASGITVHQREIEHYATAGAETKDYLVYVVSNLQDAQNLQLARNVLPSVAAYLR